MGKRFMANLHVSLDSTWKSRFSKISWGVHSTTFDPKLRNEFKNFSNPGGVHSTTFDPELRNEFKNFSNPEVVHSTTFHLEFRNERFTLISFMEFPTILSTLQPFQICILIRK